MKVLLFVILDHATETEDLLRKLSQSGYNGTVIQSNGLKHVLPKFEGQGVAISLAALTDEMPQGNFTMFIIIDQDKVETLKNEIRQSTDNFKKIKGGMFELPLLSVEGTF